MDPFIIKPDGYRVRRHQNDPCGGAGAAAGAERSRQAGPFRLGFIFIVPRGDELGAQTHTYTRARTRTHSAKLAKILPVGSGRLSRAHSIFLDSSSLLPTIGSDFLRFARRPAPAPAPPAPAPAPGPARGIVSIRRGASVFITAVRSDLPSRPGRFTAPILQL